MVLCHVVGKPKAYFLVDRISSVERGTLELLYFIDLVETDVTGLVIVREATGTVTINIVEAAYMPPPAPNSAPTAGDDSYIVEVPYGSGYQLIDVSGCTPNVGNDTDSDGPTPMLLTSNNPNAVWVYPGQTVSYTYTVQDTGVYGPTRRCVRLDRIGSLGKHEREDRRGPVRLILPKRQCATVHDRETLGRIC